MRIAMGTPRILQLEITIAEQAEQLKKQQDYIAKLEKRWADLQVKAKKRKSMGGSQSGSLSGGRNSTTIVQPLPRHVRNVSIDKLLESSGDLSS